MKGVGSRRAEGESWMVSNRSQMEEIGSRWEGGEQEGGGTTVREKQELKRNCTEGV